MAIESFIVTKECKAPIVRATGIPHRPQSIEFKRFKSGDIVKGELKHANNKPAFVLVGGSLVVPIDCVRKVVSQDVSGADGNKSDEKPIKEKIVPMIQKVQYIDAIVIGAVLGVAGAYLAEKQGWVVSEDNKIKMYGALIGVGAALYITYRLKSSQKAKITVKE